MNQKPAPRGIWRFLGGRRPRQLRTSRSRLPRNRIELNRVTKGALWGFALVALGSDVECRRRQTGSTGRAAGFLLRSWSNRTHDRAVGAGPDGLDGCGDRLQAQARTNAADAAPKLRIWTREGRRPDHDVSCRRDGSRRSAPTSFIDPPQQGQMSSARPVNWR